MKRVLIAVAAMFIAFVGYRMVVAAKSRAAPAEKGVEVPLVETAHAAKMDVVESLSLTGTVRPKNEVNVYAKVSGRIESVGAQVGDRVKAGQALVSIEHREVGWQARSAAAQEQVAKANLEGAKLELDRTETLFKGGSASQSTLDSARVRYQLMQAQLAKDQAAAGLAEQQLANSRVDSPISGTVIRRPVNVGMQVAAQTVLFTIQDVQTLKLETSVDAAAFVRLGKGTEVQVRVDAQPDAVFRGKVTLLSPSLDSQTRRAAVEIEVDNSNGKLLPNMFARATVRLGLLKGIVAIPRDAILEAPGGAVVFRVQDSAVKSVRPRLGPEDNGWVAVLSGLSDGDEVATTGLANLAEGALIRAAPSRINALTTNEAPRP